MEEVNSSEVGSVNRLGEQGNLELRMIKSFVRYEEINSTCPLHVLLTVLLMIHGE